MQPNASLVPVQLTHPEGGHLEVEMDACFHCVNAVVQLG